MNKNCKKDTFKVLFFSTMILLAALFLAWHLTKITPQDVQYYQETTDTSDAHLGVPYTAKQQRFAVRKELFFTQGIERLQMRLLSKEAYLVLDRQDEGTSLIEQMHKVTCYMQEEVYYLLNNGQEATRQENGKLLIRNASPQLDSSWVSEDSSNLQPMQVVRRIDAEKAIYYYETDQLVAENVAISRLVFPGRQLNETSLTPLQPIMSGFAKKIEISLGRDKLNFKATQLHAKIFDLGRI